jgi:transcriptional regulator with XRE-family HTH domain
VITMSKFSENLKMLRKRYRYSQTQLAEKIGVGRSAISMWEIGDREPDFETLEALADIFNVDMDFLTGRKAEKAPTENGERKVTDDDIKAAFWGGENDLSQEDIDALWEDARAYIEFKTSQKRGKKRR